MNYFAQVCLATTRKSVKAQAIQNKVMEKEILIHQRTKHQLLEATARLKDAILSMKREAHKKLDHRIGRRRSK